MMPPEMVAVGQVCAAIFPEDGQEDYHRVVITSIERMDYVEVTTCFNSYSLPNVGSCLIVENIVLFPIVLCPIPQCPVFPPQEMFMFIVFSDLYCTLIKLGSLADT